MKNILIGIILGVLFWLLIFKLIGLSGILAWVIFFALGVVVALFVSKPRR